MADLKIISAVSDTFIDDVTDIWFRLNAAQQTLFIILSSIRTLDTEDNAPALYGTAQNIQDISDKLNVLLDNTETFKCIKAE